MLVETTRKVWLYDDEKHIVEVTDDNADGGNVVVRVRLGHEAGQELLWLWLDPAKCREIADALTEAANAVEALVPDRRWSVCSNPPPAAAGASGG